MRNEIPNSDELRTMRDVDIRQVSREDLVDINDVVLDPDLPPKERMKEFIRQVKNPYCYRDGDYVVKVSFAGKKTLEECLASYLNS